MPHLAMVLLTTFLMTFSLASAAYQGPYLGVKGGVSQLRDMNYDTESDQVLTEYSSGHTVSLVAGIAAPYDRGFRLRTELEAGRQGASVSGTGRSGDTRTRFGFFSLYGDRLLSESILFIFGAGAGVAEVSFEGHQALSLGTGLDDRDVSFGYQLTAGFGVELSERWTLEGTYRFQSWEDLNVQTQGGTENELRVGSHNLQLGLRLAL